MLIIVVVLALVNPPAEPAKGQMRPAPMPLINKAESARESPVVPDIATSKQKAEPAVVVRIDGEEDKEYPAEKLSDAFDKAMGGRGYVELRNSKPLHLTSANHKRLDFSQGRGPLIIRACQGRSASSTLK